MEDIRIRGLEKAFGDKQVLREVSLTIPAGGTVCLMAPSGAGKTTLLRMLAGLETPDAGEITGLAAYRTGMVFQEDRLIPWRTVLENVALFAADPGAAETALERVGLAEWSKAFPHQLSGGMARRAALARAVAMRPDLLLLDEPFNGLDPDLRRQIADLLLEGRDERLTEVVAHTAEDRQMLRAQTVFLTPPVTGQLSPVQE